MAKPYRKQPDDRVSDDLTTRGMGHQIRDSLMEKNRALLMLTGDSDPLVPSVGAAPVNEPYVTIGNTSGLSAERALTGTANEITVTDNGANSSVVLSSPLSANPYVTIGNTAALSAERALTGTANQITVTDNGANSSVVLSTPQNLHTATIFQVAQLGIGAAASSSPAVHLDVTGRTRFVTVVQSFSVGQTNYDIGSSTVLRLTATNPVLSIRGFTNGIDGRVVIIINAGTTNAFRLVHDAVATAANRFYTSTLQDIIVSPGASKIAVYDGTLLRWRVSDWMTPDGSYLITGAFTWNNTLVVDGDGAGLLRIIKSGSPRIEFNDAATGNTLLLGPASLSGATVLSLPDATDTLVARATTDNLSNKTFITLTTFDTTGGNAGQIRLKGDSAGSLPFLQFFSLTGSSTMMLVPAALTGTVTVTLPNASDTLVGKSTTDTLANKTLGPSCKLLADTTLSGVAFTDTGDTTKAMRHVLSACATGVRNSIQFANTVATDYTMAVDLSGTVPIVGNDPPAVATGNLGKVDLTAQTANIATTNLSNTPSAGFYEVEVILMATTSAVGAGTLAVVIGWTDNVGATTSTVISAFSLTGTGRTTGRALLRVASGDITYAVTVTGIYSTAQYAVYARVIALG